MLQPITPKNVKDLSVKEVLKLCPMETGENLSAIKIYKVVSILFQVMGYQLTNDIIMMIVSQVQHRLIIATAGSGKTSMTQIIIITLKILHQWETGKRLWGSSILCLVYNDHNVEDMKIRHEAMVARIERSGILQIDNDTYIDIDDKIEASTLHSFTKMWMKDYAEMLGTVDFTLIDQEWISIGIMRNLYENILIKKYPTERELYYPEILRAYNLAKEMLLPFNDPQIAEMVPGVNPELIEKLFLAYEARKKSNKQYDYIDMLYLPYKLMLTYESVAKRIASNYSVIVVDETQDFTPLMWDIIRVLGKYCKVIIVGDEDQTIYNFKGARVQNILNFNHWFKDGKIFTLNYNRRCGRRIVEASTHIISENKGRFDKTIDYVRSGGEVNLIPYSSEDGMLWSLVKKIENMSEHQRSNLAIAYRDRAHSTVLLELLEERGISFNMLSGVAPFTHELYGLVKEVLDAIRMPYNMHHQMSLYKVLPINRKDWLELIGYDSNRKMFPKSRERIHFKDIDYGKYSKYSTFTKELKYLAQLSEVIEDKPLNTYFPFIFEMLCKYEWDYVRKRNKENNKGSSAYDDMYTDKVFNLYNCGMRLEVLQKDLENRNNTVNANKMSKRGITVGTFHSLKGLEFDEVEMIYMDDSQFPKIELEHNEQDDDKAEENMESETRLCFVAMTRAKNILNMRYKESNPSYYVRRLMKFYAEGGTLGETIKVEEAPKFIDLPEVIEQKSASSAKDPEINNSSDQTKVESSADVEVSSESFLVGGMSFDDTDEEVIGTLTEEAATEEVAKGNSESEAITMEFDSDNEKDKIISSPKDSETSAGVNLTASTVSMNKFSMNSFANKFKR